MRTLGPVACLVVVALLVAACDAAPGASDGQTPVGVQAADQGYVLRVGLPSAAWTSTDDIAVTTTLLWTGGAAQGTIWGSGGGPVFFTFAEVGGRGRTMGGGMTADCRPSTYPRGVPVAIALAKSGGFSADDPDAAFYQAWYREPGLHLPIGHWQLTAGVSGFLAPCAAGAPALELKTAPVDLVIR